MKRVFILLMVILATSFALAQDWQDTRINNDTTTELQNEQQVVVNPTDPSNLVAAYAPQSIAT